MDRVFIRNRKLVIADSHIEELLKLADKASHSLAPVILFGETGTGKELIARYIHEKSKVAQGPFVSVNCAAIPEGLLESEFFGYERGAFTGAVSQRIGKFERASGGTLLLDEISEMPIFLQSKMLRVLQEGEIDRLGGRDPIAIQCRIIATTNRNLAELVARGEFREDLYYRLSVIQVDCLPLRGREEAIRNLALEFLHVFSEKYGRAPILKEDAFTKLSHHAWSGNVRELQNVIERLVLTKDKPTISAKDLDLNSFTPHSEEMMASKKTLAQLEQAHIMRVLDETGGNRNEAAMQLGITARTLRNKLKLYGV